MANTVLVTGGAGYIGSHTCKALAKSGWIPVVFDNLSLGRADAVRWGPMVVGDTRDQVSVTSALQEHGCVAVIHFAARSSVGESMADPMLYYDNNVGGLIGVLAGMRATGCDVMVFSSSAAIYGEPENSPIPETGKAEPISPYGRTKWMGEQMLVDHAAAYGSRSIALRYFNAAGADPEGDVGEFREFETHLIPRALMSLQGWVDDFEVFGSDFPTPDGTAVRDYVHVSDLADAHVSALKRAVGRPGHEVFNIGAGRGWSVADVLSAVIRTTGTEMASPKGTRRPGDPATLVADGTLAQRNLGFTPRYSDLDTIVQTAWSWHQKAHPRKA